MSVVRTLVSFVQRNFAAEAAVWAPFLVAVVASATWVAGRNAFATASASDAAMAAATIAAFGCVTAWLRRRDRRLK
jgi:hypothetical protein